MTTNPNRFTDFDLSAVNSNIEEEVKKVQARLLQEALTKRYSQELSRILKDKQIKTFNDILKAAGDASDTISKQFITWIMEQPLTSLVPKSSLQAITNEGASNAPMVPVTVEQVLDVINSSATPVGVNDITKLLSQSVGNVNPDQVKEHTAFLKESKQVLTEGQKRGMKYKSLPSDDSSSVTEG